MIAKMFDIREGNLALMKKNLCSSIALGLVEIDKATLALKKLI